MCDSLPSFQRVEPGGTAKPSEFKHCLEEKVLLKERIVTTPSGGRVIEREVYADRHHVMYVVGKTQEEWEAGVDLFNRCSARLGMKSTASYGASFWYHGEESREIQRVMSVQEVYDTNGKMIMRTVDGERDWASEGEVIPEPLPITFTMPEREKVYR